MVVLVLGKAHDLSDNVRRLGKGGVELVTVTMQSDVANEARE
jgi:2-keto-3-deoxy-6-phosphogluconate aldolase